VDPFNLQEVVIYRPGQFGDTVAAFPVLEAIKTAYPHLKITYLTNSFEKNEAHVGSKNIPIVPGDSVANLSTSVDDTYSYQVGSRPWKILMSLRSKLKNNRRTALLYMNHPTTSSWRILRDYLFFSSFGFEEVKGFRTTWSQVRSQKEEKSIVMKESDRLIELAVKCGFNVSYPLKCSVKTDDTWLKNKWTEWDLNKKTVLAMCVGSKMQSKRWPLEKFIEVGKKWHKMQGSDIVVVGGPEEIDIANYVVGKWDGYGHSACGVNLNQTAAVLSASQLYCGNDTGSMHLAAVMGIPTVSIFSSLDIEGRWSPYGTNHKVIRNPIECSGCMLSECFADPAPCIDMTTTDTVIAAIKSSFN